MPQLELRLLGAPAIERDGSPQPPPRGRKAWALLAYLVCEDLAASREHLAELLFPDANDPLGALRWNLAQLRRALGADVVRTRSVELVLPPDARVDVHALKREGWQAAVSLPGLGRDLLEGMTFPACPALETWLMMERRRLIAASEAALREAVVARLAAGDARSAADAAGRLVGLNPYDDSFQELLIRSFAAAGDHDAARRQLDACIELYRRELRRQPAPSVIDAAGQGTQPPPPATDEPQGVALAWSQLERGQSAVDRGSFEEGAWLLTQAASTAAGRFPEVQAAAACETASLEIRFGRYQRCGRQLILAEQHAGGDPAVLGRVAVLQGIWMSETGWHERALPHLRRAIELARQAEHPRLEARALATLGRLHLLRGELGEARGCLEAALDVARQDRWSVFLAWPDALLGHVELEEGDVGGAATRLRRAFDDAGESGFVPLRAVSARGLGLVEVQKRGPEAALEGLRDAATLAESAAACVWIEAFVLDALCEVTATHRLPGASRSISDLRSLALHSGMREFAVRAWIHQAVLSGTPPGPAGPLVFGVQNERLTQRVNELLGKPAVPCGG